MNNLNENLGNAGITIYIARGCAGSGKTTLINKYSNNYRNFAKVSCDYFWRRPDGEYDFNPKLLKQAHDWCFKEYLYWLRNFEAKIVNYSIDSASIFVDNTNLEYKEFHRYIAKAVEHKCSIVLLEPGTPWQFDTEECFKRNQHNVPLATIQRMILRWQSSEECADLIRSEFGVDVSIQIGISNDSTRS